jgi:hypothetical protein
VGIREYSVGKFGFTHLRVEQVCTAEVCVPQAREGEIRAGVLPNFLPFISN